MRTRVVWCDPHALTDSRGRRAVHRRGWVLALVCACFAFLTHTLPFRSRVFHPFGLVLYGDGDAYYHLRRIRAIAAHWPRVPDFDSYMNYPQGAYSIWAPGFDFVPATLSRLGLPLDTVAVYWPAILGALTCLPFYAYCRRRFGTGAAVGACILLAVTPATVLIGALGRIDHHVAELLFQLLIYAQLQRCCSTYEADAEIEPADWVWLGLSMAGALLTWSGSLLFLVVPAALGVASNVFAPKASTRRVSRTIARAFILAGLIALPYGVLNAVRGREPFSPNFPSLLQTAACLLMAVVVYSAARARALDGSVRRLPLAVGAAVPLVLLCVPGVASGLVQGLAFLSRDQSAWLTTISEFQPLFSRADTFEHGVLTVGYALLLIPVALAWQSVRLVRQGRCSASDLLLLLWASHVFALALLQLRFLHYTVPVIALLPWWLFELARPRWRRAATALALVPVLLSWPLVRYYAPMLRGGLPAYPQYRADLFELLRNLPQQTPPVQDAGQPQAKPAYCIFAEWELGHLIVEVAQRPVVANNFGTHLEGRSYSDSHEFFQVETDEGKALAIVEGRGCRYILTPARSPQREPSLHPHFARRVHDADGSDTAMGSGSGRLRLLLETLGPPVSGQPAYKLFELVRGALLRVGSDTGELWAETHIRSARRDFWYRRRLTGASELAMFETRLAHPGAYRLLQDGRPVFRFNVSLDAVTRGKTIRLSQR